jgi:preprotein translocase subunit SecF
MRVKAIFAVILAVAILAAAVLTLTGCNAAADEQRAQAARLQAEAELARAEAARERAAADAEAALERAQADRARAVAEAEAQRQRAAAEKAQAEADAYQKRIQADTSAAAERTALRQSERDAAVTRWLTLLPVLALAFGLVAIGGLAVVVLANRRGQAVDPDVVFLLQRQDRRLQELERATWHTVAAEQRRQLSAGSGPIIVYDGEGRVIGDE